MFVGLVIMEVIVALKEEGFDLHVLEALIDPFATKGIGGVSCCSKLPRQIKGGPNFYIAALTGSSTYSKERQICSTEGVNGGANRHIFQTGGSS
jgi:hypothetical protein